MKLEHKRSTTFWMGPLLRQIPGWSDVWLLNSRQDFPTPVLFKTQISISLCVMANGSNNAEHESLTNTTALNMKTKLFFKKQKNKVIYKQDLESISWFQKWNESKICGETRTFHPCFGEGLLYNIQSAVDGLVERCLYINFKSFLLVHNHEIFPRPNGQSCGFFPFSYSQQGDMTFNSGWAAYNSSSLGANMTGGSDFPVRNNWPPTAKYKNRQSFFRLPFDYVQCLLSRLLSPTYLFLQSKPWGDIRRPTSRKENSIQKWRKLEGIQYTPRTSQIIPSTVQFIVPLVQYWQLELMHFFPPQVVKEHQTNTGQEEFAGRVRNRKLIQFLSL